MGSVALNTKECLIWHGVGLPAEPLQDPDCLYRHWTLSVDSDSVACCVRVHVLYALCGCGCATWRLGSVLRGHVELTGETRFMDRYGPRFLVSSFPRALVSSFPRSLQEPGTLVCRTLMSSPTPTFLRSGRVRPAPAHPEPVEPRNHHNQATSMYVERAGGI